MKKPMIIMSICFVVSLLTLNFGTIFIIPIFCYLLENLIKVQPRLMDFESFQAELDGQPGISSF